jgi:hypothetical protein
MTSFQSLSFSGGSGISTRGQVLHRHSARGSLHDNKPGHPVSSRQDSRFFVSLNGTSIHFPSRKPYVLDSLFVHQPDLLGRLTARGLLYECVFVTPSFPSIASTYQKHAPTMCLLDLPSISIQTFLEGVMALPNSG